MADVNLEHKDISNIPSNPSNDPTNQEIESGDKIKRLKPCCACPETRKLRDMCYLQKGGEEFCLQEISAHKDCMRSLGFYV